MCGLNLIINKDGSPVARDYLAKANHSLKHRGPDNETTFFYRNIGLGHTRLDIVDIINGQQPIFNEDHSIAVICNGEIYSYKKLRKTLQDKGHIFKTNSDSEVIVHLYEQYGSEKYILELDGMFSFLLLDMQKNHVHIVRDRMGIKPLYYYSDHNNIIVSSEIKPILMHPNVSNCLSHSAVHDILTFSYNIGENTCFQNIKILQPATQAIYDLNSNAFSQNKYWFPTFPRANSYESDDINYYKEKFIEIFDETINNHLIGEVPISAYMSGGIDSTAAAIIANKHLTSIGSQLKTFSISFSDKKFDESLFFEQVISKNKLNAHIFELNDWSFDTFEKTITHLEQPQLFTLDIANFLLSKCIRSQGYKVAITGDGSDEILGGYNHFSINEFRKQTGKCNLIFKKLLLNWCLKRYGYKSDFYKIYNDSTILQEKEIIEKFGTIPPWYPIWFLSDCINRPLFKDRHPECLTNNSDMAKICQPLHDKYLDIDDFNKTIFVEMNTRLPNWVLWKADRNSMANSVEVRVPYLDNKIINFFSRVPPKIKSRFLNEKYILRKSFKKILPPNIINRRKFAFNTPTQWLFDGSSNHVNELLSEKYINESNIFDYRQVCNLKQQVRNCSREPQNMFDIIMIQTLVGVITTQILYKVSKSI